MIGGYLADNGLHESVEAAFGRVQVARDLGGGDLLLEERRVVRECHVVYVAVGWHTLTLTVVTIAVTGFLVGAHARVVERARRRVHERQRFLLDKRAEAEAEVARDAAHARGEQLAELAQLGLVRVHRVGQVHEKVKVDRVVLGQLIRDVEAMRHV